MQVTFAGDLARRFGASHSFAVKTPNEAIRALCQLIPGFRSFMTSAHEKGIFFQIITSNSDEGITYDDLGLGCRSFTLVPVITGSLFGLFKGKGGGILAILAGVALVAFAMTGFGTGIFVGLEAGSFLAGVQTATMSLGFGLLFTGVAQLFAPGVPTGTKNISEGRDADDSISSGAAPVAVNGEAVPLLFGEYLVSRMPVVASYIKNNEGFFMGLISEGQIEGYPEGGAAQNLYLDGLLAASSVVRTVELTNGAQDTAIIDNVKSAGFSIPVNAPFNAQGGNYDETDDGVANTSITRTFTQKEADTIRVRLSVGPVYQSRTRSDEDGSEQNYRNYSETDESGGADNPTHMIITIIDGDGTVIADTETIPRIIDGEDNREVRPLIYERQTATKLHEYVFKMKHVSDDVPRPIPSPISIQVSRVDRRGPRGPLTVTSSSKQKNYSWAKSGVTWVSADVLWNEKLVYPFSSLLALSFQAGEFSRFPDVQVRLKGLRVPTLTATLEVNYAFSNNPAYVLLALLTDPRFGAGHRDYDLGDGVTRVQPGIRITDIDLASFLAAAEYCEDNEITFNGYVNKDCDALELFRGIASTFQAQLIYAGGFITLVIDQQIDDDEVRIYSAANTIGSGDDAAAPHFAYEGSARRSRSTAVEVSYVDPGEFYQERKALIESPELIDRYGYNLTKIRALGCTNEPQARRMGRYTLASNTLSTDTVSFKVGPDGAMLLPGDVCLILDPLKTGMISGGRVRQASTNVLITDRELTERPYSDPDSNFFLYVYGQSGVAKSYTITSASTSGSITIDGEFDTIPTTNDMWGIVKRSPNKQLPKEPMYRVQSVKEEGDGTYSVVGIKYVKQKFPFVNGDDAILQTHSYSRRFNESRRLTLNSRTISFSLRTPD